MFSHFKDQILPHLCIHFFLDSLQNLKEYAYQFSIKIDIQISKNKQMHDYF